MKQRIIKPRERVLETVSKLFHKQGYNATGINQIVEESGVVKSSVYQIFGSKEEIAIAYLNERHDFWFRGLNSFISSSQGIMAKLMAAFDYISFMNKNEDYQGCAFLNFLVEIPAENIAIREVIVGHKNELRYFFHNLLLNTGIDANHIYLLFEGAIMESKLFREEWPIDTAKSIIQSIYIKQNGTEISFATV